MSCKASILIACHNKVELTRDCLEQLRRVTPPSLYELVLVNNASTDGTRACLDEFQASMPRGQVTVLHQRENLGFVGANNLAAESARGDFLVFLNNDTLPQPGWLEALVTVAQADPTVGAVGSKLVYPDGSLQEAGGAVFRDGTGMNYGRSGHPGHPAYAFVREVDYCSGACLLTSAALFRSLGGFDTRYAPAYYEDSDLCFSIRKAGLRVLYQPESVVVHFEGGTAGTDLSSGFKKHQEINRPKFVRKWVQELALQGEPSTDRLRMGRAAHRFKGSRILMAHDAPPMYDRAAGSLRLDHLVRMYLAEGHQVSFVCLHGRTFEGAEVEPYMTRLRRMGVMVHALELPLARGFKERPETGWKAFEALLLEREYDVAHLPWHYSAAQFIPHIRQHSPRTRIVIDCQDVHFRREARRLMESNDPGMWVKYRKDKSHELANYRSADAMMVVTEEDRECLQRELPERAVHCVPDYYPVKPPEEIPAFGPRADLVFVGGFRHVPNTDAVTWFCREIWPLVSPRLPDAKFHIVGDAAPPDVKRLAGGRVIVHGHVKDLSALLGGARLSVAPIRYGAGMKGKITNALAHGLPSVATPVAAEGMGLSHGRDILVAASPSEFADAVVRLYQDESLWNSVSAAGIQLVESLYGHRAIYPKLAEALRIGPRADAGSGDLSDPMRLAEHMSGAYDDMRAGAYAEAEAKFRGCLEANPGFAWAMVGIGLSLSRRGRFAEAEPWLRRAMGSTDRPASALTAFGQMLVAAGKPIEGASCIQEAIRLEPDSLWAVNEAALLAERCGNMAVAAQGYGRLAELDATAVWPVIKQAEALAALGATDRLPAVFEEAIRRARARGDESLAEELERACGSHLPAQQRAA